MYSLSLHVCMHTCMYKTYHSVSVEAREQLQGVSSLPTMLMVPGMELWSSGGAIRTFAPELLHNYVAGSWLFFFYLLLFYKLIEEKTAAFILKCWVDLRDRRSHGFEMLKVFVYLFLSCICFKTLWFYKETKMYSSLSNPYIQKGKSSPDLL